MSSRTHHDQLIEQDPAGEDARSQTESQEDAALLVSLRTGYLGRI